MNFNSKTCRLIPLAFAAVATIGFAISGAAHAAPVRTGVVNGGACTVLDGTHKGKTGTYSTDSDGMVWCDVKGGSTECTGGRCKDGAAKLSRPIYRAPTTFNFLSR